MADTAPYQPKIVVIGTGGTVSMLGKNSLDLHEYGDHGKRLEIDELLTRYPEISDEAEIVPVRFRALRSPAVTPIDWLELNELIHSVAEKHHCDGVVVTHGTSSLEETAYFLNLTLRCNATVVLVGAQRPPSAISTDAPLNLRNAVRVAGAHQARGLGVLVVLNDEIQAAREVTKASTYRLETFRSPDLGMLGYADSDSSVVIYRAPRRRHAPDSEFDVRGIKELPRVDIAYSYPGADGAAIKAFVDAGAKAIVSAGQGAGQTTEEEATAIDLARKEGVVIVQSNRTGSGRVMQRTTLSNRGIVAADNLNPQKARVLAMLALTVTGDPVRIQRFFNEY